MLKRRIIRPYAPSKTGKRVGSGRRDCGKAVVSGRSRRPRFPEVANTVRVAIEPLDPIRSTWRTSARRSAAWRPGMPSCKGASSHAPCPEATPNVKQTGSYFFTKSIYSSRVVSVAFCRRALITHIVLIQLGPLDSLFSSLPRLQAESPWINLNTSPL